MESDNRHLLGLRLATDPRWADLVESDIGYILSDHAYCEQKAATNCIRLIHNYSDHDRLVDEISPIVSEEWGHFRLVLAELRKRGLALGAPRKDEYVNELRKFQFRGGKRSERLLDELLSCALIEARSCERFRVLSEHLKEPYLQKFYHRFMVSEAGHYRCFLDLAIHYLGEDVAMPRWQAFLDHEINILESLPARADRMH